MFKAGRFPSAVLLILVLVTGCSASRPLTAPEAAFAVDLLGAEFDPAPVRIHQSNLIGRRSFTYPVRPRSACREMILPPPEGTTFETRTAGVVVGTQLTTTPDWNLPNYVPAYPDMHLIAAMFFAHEMVHVWQWQNRDKTGYHPLKAAAEHARPGRDPYLFEASPEQPFLSYPFEQQAAIVEEYICCQAVDPAGARTTRLRDLISAAMDTRPLPRGRIAGVWEGADLRGICS